MESCRLCLKKRRNMLPIFEESEASLEIRQCILDCCPIKLIHTEKLPAHVCAECRLKLNAAYNFREQCRLSDRKLRLAHPKLFKTWTPKTPKKRVRSKKDKVICIDDTSKDADTVEGEDANVKLKETRPCTRSVQVNDNYVEDSEEDTSPLSSATTVLKPPDSQKKKIVLICDICGKTLGTKSGLRYHLKSHVGLKPYTCSFCNKCFSIPSYKERHERTHAGVKRFVCDVCSAAFASANGLKYHQRSHTGEANYRCETCGKCFRRHKYLKEHIFTHTGERPFVCQICSSAYSNSGSLFTHQKKCKGKLQQSAQEMSITQQTSTPVFPLEETLRHSVVSPKPKREASKLTST